MEVPYRPPNILRLVGVSLGDYVPVEDRADAALLADGADAAAPEADMPFDSIPRVFTGLEDWPHRTNLRCWQCDFTFDDRPKFVPTHVREAEAGGVEFGVRGNMCTFNCAELWIDVNYDGKPDLRWRAKDNLRLVYFMFTGVRVSRVRPAPPKTEMRRYGGDLDEDAFWKKLRSLDAVAGLRDHTPGSVVPDRGRAPPAPLAARAHAARRALRDAAGLGGAPEPAGGAGPRDAGPAGSARDRSVWRLCGRPDDLASAPGAAADGAAADAVGDVAGDAVDVFAPAGASAAPARTPAAAAGASAAAAGASAAPAAAARAPAGLRFVESKPSAAPAKLHEAESKPSAAPAGLHLAESKPTAAPASLDDADLDELLAGLC